MHDPQMKPDLLAQLCAALDDADVRILSTDEDMAPALNDWRGRFRGAALAVLHPGTTAAVALCVRACADLGIQIVPQGGNTGLCGGATPGDAQNQVVLCLSRLNRVRNVDKIGSALTVEAGCILETVQQVADDAGKLFPLSLAAEGSAQIGGVLATNAGGTAVLKYGTARDLVLGLEVVLPDGTVWDGLRSLRKNNTGYDLRHLFVGSEGTLGIITAAVLKMHPKPRHVVACLIALQTPRGALDLLTHITSDLGDRLTAFEVFDAHCMEISTRHHPDLRNPFSEQHAWYALVEVAETSHMVPLQDMVEGTLGVGIEAGFASDIVLATSEKQRVELWKLRESISESQKREGFTLKHDISVPIAAIPGFLETAGKELAEMFPGIQIGAFGHFGDGNIHFNVRPPAASTDAEAQEHAIADVVYRIATGLDGSFSAEHGVGQLKTSELEKFKSPEEIALFRTVKASLDPQHRFNPGKMLAG
jgi:FAD/FMN-containing dehydrogenase